MPVTPTVIQSSLDRVTRIQIFIGGQEVGAIQEITPSESREVSQHFTLGGDAENPKVSVPGLVTKKTLSIKSLAIWNNPLINQLGNDGSATNIMYSLNKQQTPFNIQVQKTSASDATKKYTITYIDCMLTSFDYNQDISKGGDVVIVESCSAVYRDMSVA